MRVKANLTYSQFKELIPETFTKKRESGYGDFRVAVGQQASNFRAKHLPATKKVEDRQAQWRVWLGEIEFEEKWEFIKNIDDDTVNDMRQGKRDGEYAIAIYYRFHSLLKDPSFADAIDEAVFGEPLRNQRTKVFSKLEPFDIVSSTGSPIGVRPTTPDTTERRDLALPQLNLTQEQSASGLHYSNRLVEVLGREKEYAELREFMSGQGFCWLQLSGTGGQGKSRLAHELVLEYAAEHKWHAGFLNDYYLAEFSSHWANWQPSKPTLVVFDYVMGRENAIGVALNCLAKRSREFEHSVRVLLLERQPWNRSERESSDASDWERFGFHSIPYQSTTASWFQKLCSTPQGSISGSLIDTKFSNGVVELRNLDAENLCKITRAVAEQHRYKIRQSNDDIFEQLQHIDRTNSPLYAYFLGHNLSHGGFEKNWKQEDLLTDELVRLQTQRWTAQFGSDCPSIRSNSLSMRLAVLATMIGEVDPSRLCKHSEWEGLDDQSIRSAIVLADGYLGPKAILPTSIKGMQPDVLAEWFVLFSLTGQMKNSLEPLARIAHELEPQKFTNFLLRCMQDFRDNLNILKLTEAAAGAGNTDANYLLGVRAELLDRNWSLAIKFYKAAAATGSHQAIYRLGQCYLDGTDPNVGVKPRLAASWFKKIASVENSLAAYSLAMCHMNSKFIGSNKELAMKWFETAAHGGHHRAMYHLGCCYLEGTGTDIDLKKAVEWFENSASLGNGFAMYELAICYQNGLGITADFGKANNILQDARSAVDPDYIPYLAVCYATRTKFFDEYVSTSDYINLLSSAADQGHGCAAYELAICYQNGEGVKKDYKQALQWLRSIRHAEFRTNM